MTSGYYIYKIKVVEGLGSFLSGCLMQLAKYTIHNHCLISLSATRLTTVWLKQPICFCCVAPTVNQWLWPSCSTWTNSSCIKSNPRNCPKLVAVTPHKTFGSSVGFVTMLSFNHATGLSRIARSFPDKDWTHFVFFKLGSVISTSLSSESSTTSTSSPVALLFLAILKWSFCAAKFQLELVEHFDLVFLVEVNLVEVGLVEAGLVEAGLVEAGLWWLASYNY